MTPSPPAQVCHRLLAALDASEGRRRRRPEENFVASGPARTMGLEVLADWRQAQTFPPYRLCLMQPLTWTTLVTGPDSRGPIERVPAARQGKKDFSR